MTNEYESPNYTQIPNTLLDEHMPKMKEAELRVTLAIARNTFGWHRQSHRMSLSYLAQATGMSRKGVVSGIQDGMERGTIKREAVGVNSYEYSLVVTQSNLSTRLVTQSNQASNPKLPVLVTQSNPTKKGKENNKENNRFVSDTQPQKRQTTARQKRYSQHAAEAQKIGVTPKELGALTSAYLACFPEREAIANSDTAPDADKYLNAAKDAALTGLAVGIKTPEDVQKRAATVKATDFGLKGYSQIHTATPAAPRRETAV